VARQAAGTRKLMEKFGKAVRHEWALDWDFLTVNHGSFGATPKVVLAAQAEWRRRLEAQPSRFMRTVLPDALRDAATRLAQFLNVDGKDLAFVENATQGCNAVLRSLRLAPGDEIVALSHGYGAVRNTVRYVTERAGARMVDALIPFPRPHPDAIVANLQAALTPRTRLAVLDHITSGSALVLPLARMAAACHAAGVPVLIDGAHGPGQVTLDLRALNTDWYVGNCHKWLCAPKGCGFLHARPDRQDDLHPVTISHGYNKGFLAEFDWTGTWDPSAFLCVTDAIAFHERLGGETLRTRNIALAAEGATLIAGRLGTETGAGNELSGSMGVVRLPLAGEISVERAQALRRRMLEAGTDVPIHVQADAAWLRISAAAYNEVEDYATLAGIAAKVIAQE
jgi:isopenicillin-N epimerase